MKISAAAALLGAVLGGYILGDFLPVWKPASGPRANDGLLPTTLGTRNLHPVAGPGGGPPVELRSVLMDSNPLRQAEGILNYVKSIPLEQIPEAVEQLQKHAAPGKDQMLTMLVSRWVQEDPSGARDTLATEKDYQVRYLLLREIYTGLARQDPAAALEQAHDLPTDAQRDQAVDQIVQTVAEQDPAAALHMWQGIKTSSRDGLNSIFKQWAVKDLDQATQAAMQLPSAQDRSRVILSMATRLAQDDPTRSLAWVDELAPGSAQNEARRNVLGRWAFNDPQAAAAYLTHLGGGVPDELGMAMNVASSWSQSDPHSTAAWAQTLTGRTRTAALNVAVSNWARNDPKAALDFVNTLSSDPRMQAEVAGTAASKWAQADPHAALAWATALPAGTLRERALGGVVNGWAAQDPAGAMSYIQALPPGELRTGALLQAENSWMTNDPAGAARWAATQPDSEQKQGMYSQLAETWTHNDPEGASNWLAQLPSGAARDGAVCSFCQQIFEADPASAYQWASSIGDSNRRQQQVASTLREWMSVDRTSAADAVRQSDLPPREKESILQTTP